MFTLSRPVTKKVGPTLKERPQHRIYIRTLQACVADNKYKAIVSRQSKMVHRLDKIIFEQNSTANGQNEIL